MIIGLDLAVNEQEITGLCVLEDNDINTVLEVKTNSEILKIVNDLKPDVITIDAPLSFPIKGNLRKAEEELNNLKIKFIPAKGLLKAEQKVVRAIALKEEFENKGILVLEVKTGSFYDLLNIPRQKNHLFLKRVLKVYGVNISKGNYSQIQLDAIATAFMGRLFLETKVEFLGNEDEGQIIIPKMKK